MPMHDPARRRFLQSAAAIAALAAADSHAGPSAVPRAGVPTSRPAQLSDIDHIIVLMKENRSFDHYFGTLAGVRGFDDRSAMTLPDGRPVFEQPDEASARRVIDPRGVYGALGVYPTHGTGRGSNASGAGASGDASAWHGSSASAPTTCAGATSSN